ncbi:MAG: hypothetical protein WBF90_13845 [Rivularia sp. (in: cyanobacteria)]
MLGSFPHNNRCSKNVFYLSSIVALSSALATLVSTALYNKTDKQLDVMYWQIEEARNTKPTCSGCIFSSGDNLLPCAIHPTQQEEDCPDKTLIN